MWLVGTSSECEVMENYLSVGGQSIGGLSAQVGAIGANFNLIH